MQWSKPAPGTKLQTGHPLMNGLLIFCPFNEGGGVFRNLLARPSNPIDSLSATYEWAASSRFGGALRHLAITDQQILGRVTNIPLPMTTGCTVAVGYRKTDATLRASVAFDVASGTLGAKLRAHLPYSDGVVYWDFGGQTSGTTRLAVSGLTFGDDFWVFSTGGRGMEVWQNGSLKGSNAANPARTVNDSAINFVLGKQGVVDGDLADFSYFALWNRQLTQRDVRSLSGQPFQLFASPLSGVAAHATSPGGDGGGGGQNSSLLLMGVG